MRCEIGKASREMLVTGCTLYDSKGNGPGGDVPGGGGNGSPIGATFVVSRNVTGGIPVRVSRDIASPTVVLVEGDVAQSIVVQAVSANEGAGDPPNVRFTHAESRNTGEGAFPSIDTQLWVDGVSVTGRAQTTFEFVSDGTSTVCTYSWTLSG